MPVPNFSLPADLPENWLNGQIVSPDGTSVGLTEQHGYNALNRYVNDAQKALNALREYLETAGFATQSSLDTAVASLLPKSGGTMTGIINHGGNRATNIATPTANTDAATKQYVDGKDTAMKAYVDGATADIESLPKIAFGVASFSNGTFSVDVSSYNIPSSAPYSILITPLYTGSATNIVLGAYLSSVSTKNDALSTIRGNCMYVYSYQTTGAAFSKAGGSLYWAILY